MTIPATNNWCAACDEAVHDHATICTVCGEPLGPPPPPPQSATTATAARLRLVPETLTLTASLRASTERLRTSTATQEDLRTATLEVQSILSELQGSVRALTAVARRQPTEGGNGDDTDEWQAIPEGLLDPQQGAAATNTRPTSKQVLAKLPRTLLTPHSSFFRQARLQVVWQPQQQPQQQQQQQQQQQHDTVKTTLPSPPPPPPPFQCTAIPAEFGGTTEHSTRKDTLSCSRVPLILATPRTAKGGLSDETKTALRASCSDVHDKHMPAAMVYIERGDGVTFRQKALLAQQAGASGVIIGNDRSSPWPYTMKDSATTNASGANGANGGDISKEDTVTIPVAMISQDDAKRLCQQSSATDGSLAVTVEATLMIRTHTPDCGICAEVFQPSHTLLTLPDCQHSFHEHCATVWLTQHNTCPMCRQELPTDDADYDAERRRRQQNNDGTSGVSGVPGGNGTHRAQWNDYYG